VPLVSDIEIVVMPRMDLVDGGTLWGGEVRLDRLSETLLGLKQSGALPAREVEVHRASGEVEKQTRLGSAYQALVFMDMPVDLFIVRDIDQWGVIFTIRTGPAEWSHRLVTDCQKFLRRVEGGYLYREGKRWPCPTERDFFDGIGQPWIEPSDRAANRVRIEASRD